MVAENNDMSFFQLFLFCLGSGKRTIGDFSSEQLQHCSNIETLFTNRGKNITSHHIIQRRAFILVAEDEKEKGEEKIATEIPEKSINPRQEWLKRIQDRVEVESQADSLDEYGGDGAYFSEDGSFIGDCKQGGERQSVYEEIPLDDPVV